MSHSHVPHLSMVKIRAVVTVYTIDIAHSTDTAASGIVFIAANTACMGSILTVHRVNVRVGARNEEKILIRAVRIVNHIPVVIVLKCRTYFKGKTTLILRILKCCVVYDLAPSLHNVTI